MVSDATSAVKPNKIDVITHKTIKPKKGQSTSGSIIVEYGPIRVRHRRASSQTLATGRRSKHDILEGEDAAKREARRAKNRLAARQLKQSRDRIEMELIRKIGELKKEQTNLLRQHKLLEERKAQLIRAIYNAKQAPLIPLVTDIKMDVYFRPETRRDLLINLQPLFETLDQKFTQSIS